MASSPLVEAVEHFSLTQLIADPNLCRNVLKDIGAEAAEVFVLVAALEARVPQTLMEHVATNDLSVVEPRLVSDLNQRGIELSRAEWAVAAWKEVIGESDGRPTMIRPSAPAVVAETVMRPSSPNAGRAPEPATVRPAEPATARPAEPATARPAAPVVAPPAEAATVRPTKPMMPPAVVAPPPAPPAQPPVPPVLPSPQSPPPERDGRNRKPLIIVAVIVLLLLAGLVGWLAHPSDKHAAASSSSSSHPASTAASSAASGASSAPPASTTAPAANLTAPLGPPSTVTVLGTVSWTDTALKVTKGQRINITATGQVSHAPGQFTGPDGAVGDLDIFSIVGGGQHHSGLIGLISGSGAPFFVGSNYNNVAASDGELYLGINDVGVANNGGQFAANVRIQQ